MAKREPKSIRCSGYPVETKSGKLVWYVHAPADNPNGVFLPDAEYARLRDIERQHKAKPAKKGVAAVYGKWPGTETEAELLAALKAQDAPRAKPAKKKGAKR